MRLDAPRARLAIREDATAMGKKIRPKAAARYLTEHGKPITESKLGQLRNTGGGPPFYKEDGRSKPVWYDTDDLDVWNPEDKPSGPSGPMTKYTSTSEYRKKTGEASDGCAKQTSTISQMP
jgi:hypothetical protein